MPDPISSTRVSASPMRVGGKVVDFNNEAYVLIKATGFDPNYDDGYQAATSLATTLIHELLHVAAGTGTYSHDGPGKYQDAVKALGASDVNDYINKHCQIRRK